MNKLRWWIAYRFLQNHPAYCWAEVVYWALGYRPLLDIINGGLKDLMCVRHPVLDLDGERGYTWCGKPECERQVAEKLARQEYPE